MTRDWLFSYLCFEEASTENCSRSFKNNLRTVVANDWFLFVQTPHCWDAWLAQGVRLLPLAQVMIPGSWVPVLFQLALAEDYKSRESPRRHFLPPHCPACSRSPSRGGGSGCGQAVGGPGRISGGNYCGGWGGGGGHPETIPHLPKLVNSGMEDPFGEYYLHFSY